MPIVLVLAAWILILGLVVAVCAAAQRGDRAAGALRDDPEACRGATVKAG